MGQRLNIEIKKKETNETIANCYYHWSAYTRSALDLTLEIIENTISVNHNEKEVDKMYAIELLQSTGGGLMQDEYDKIDDENKKYCKVSRNRNLGLISFTDEGIQETRRYEEGRVEIYIPNITDYFAKIKEIRVAFDVFYKEDIEDVKKYYREDIKKKKLNLDNLIEFDFDLWNMTRADLYEFYNKEIDIENNYYGMFKIKGDNENIYHCIY